MQNEKKEDEYLLNIIIDARKMALEIVASINNKIPENPMFYAFSPITVGYVTAFSFLADFLAAKGHAKNLTWEEVKKTAHKCLDTAFTSIEKENLVKEQLKNHVNH